VIRAKSELYAHLRENMGTVFVNAGDPLLMRLSEGMNRHTYGTGSILDAEARSQGFHLVVHWTNGPGSLKETPMQLSGSYNLQNVLAAARIGMHFDIPWQDIHDAIASYIPSNSRSELRQSGKNTLIMDAYNANPTSMEAALHNFKGLHGHPKWVILGDMLELGEAAEEEHLRILSLVDHMALEQVVLVGPLFHRLAEGRFITFAHASECLEWLKGKAPEKALILLKASRGIRLETLLPAL